MVSYKIQLTKKKKNLGHYKKDSAAARLVKNNNQNYNQVRDSFVHVSKWARIHPRVQWHFNFLWQQKQKEKLPVVCYKITNVIKLIR